MHFKYSASKHKPTIISGNFAYGEETIAFVSK